MRVLSADTSGYPFPLPNLDPPVYAEVAVSEPFCDSVRAVAEGVSVAPSGVYDPNNLDVHQANSYFRSSSYCVMPHDTYTTVATVQTALVASIVKTTVPSSKKVVLSEALQFLKYDAVNNGHFSPHTDSAFYDNGRFMYTSPHRIFTSLLYLNEGFEGGELIVNSVVDDDDKPLMFKPKKGMIVVFPSDIRFSHEVRPVTRGVRFSVVGWFNVV